MKRVCAGLQYSTLNFIALIWVCETLTLRMGLLTVRGPPKSWDESKKDLSYIRRAGVLQFISTYNRVKDLRGDELLWGDEIEYGIFRLDDTERKIRLSLRGREVCTPDIYFKNRFRTNFLRFSFSFLYLGFSNCTLGHG